MDINGYGYGVEDLAYKLKNDVKIEIIIAAGEFWKTKCQIPASIHLLSHLSYYLSAHKDLLIGTRMWVCNSLNFWS